MADAASSTNPFVEDNVPKLMSCDADNILKCESLQRIKLALNQQKDARYNEKQIKTSLMNDFFHLKYEHNLNTKHKQFHIVFDFLTERSKTLCDITKCTMIQQHFKDRATSNSMDIIARIHCYLLHSYDIARLTETEVNDVESALNEYKQSQYNELELKLDDDNEDIHIKVENLRVQITSNIMKEKQTNAAWIMKAIDSKHKYCECYHAFNYDECIFAANSGNNKNSGNNNDNGFTKEQNDLLDQFTNITAADNDTAVTFLRAIQWDISTAVDRYFLYNGDVSRLPAAPNDPNVDEKEAKDEEKEVHKQTVTNNAEIYNLGIRFSFDDEENMLYIKPKYDHLKQEVMQHQYVKCDTKQWNILHGECLCLSETNDIKQMASNEGNILSIQHLYALKLYTSYRVWCNVLCQAFRVKKDENIQDLKGKIQQLAIWGKLLTECVQYYGNRLRATDANHAMCVYRMVNAQYKFTKLNGRIFVPWSTTKSVHFCHQLAAAEHDNDGIIMVLSLYPDADADAEMTHSTKYLDCSRISCFDIEEEMLFCNASDGDILQIKSLYHMNIKTQMHYTHYIEALRNMIRLINGLKIDENASKRSKTMLQDMLKHILRTSTYKIASLPAYIEALLDNLTSNMTDNIEFEYADFVENANYHFLHEIFVKTEHVLNIANICNLFRKCKTFCFLMTDDFIMNDAFCISLISDIQNIANDITLMLKWRYPMAVNNHSILDTYRRQLSSLNWQLHLNQKCIKLTSISQFFDEKEIAQQQDLWKKFATDRMASKSAATKRIFQFKEDSIPLLVQGYIRLHCNCKELMIPLDIIKLLISMQGDYHTMYWKIFGVNFWNLIHAADDDKNEFTEIESEIYSIHILNYCMKFQLKLKKEHDNSLILSLNSVSNINSSAKQAVTVSYTMICEETQCEYRHMSVIADSDSSEWFDDFLHIAEIKALHKSQGITEINFICNIQVLHIWSQTDPYADDAHASYEEVEMMRIYHCGSKMQQQYEYEWILSKHLVPSNVTKEYTMCYSPRFDDKNWCCVFVERQDEFLVALKLLAIPFGIGVLLMRCEIDVSVNNVNNQRHVKDVILETFKYGDDDKNMAETKEWRKEDLFGVQWMQEFCVHKLMVNIKIEIVHLEGINEEQIFRINWPLYGILCDEEKDFDENNFVLTKEQFETETFGFNYMIGVLRTQINELQNEMKQLKKGNSNKYEQDYEDDKDDDEIDAVKEWLSFVVKLPNYYSLFIRNGFHSLEIIKEINDKSDLEYIGIKIKAHQIKLINKIKLLQNDNQ